MDERRREDIARRAYERYEARGRIDGDDQADWFAAEHEAAAAGPENEHPAEADRMEESVTSGRATRGRASEGAPMDEETARSSGTGPTATPPGTGPGGNVRTTGTAVSGGPTEPGR